MLGSCSQPYGADLPFAAPTYMRQRPNTLPNPCACTCAMQAVARTSALSTLAALVGSASASLVSKLQVRVCVERVVKIWWAGWARRRSWVTASAVFC